MRISVHTAQVFERAGSLDEGFAMLRRAGIEGIQFGMGGYFMPAASVRGHKPSVLDEPLDHVLELVRPYKEAADRQGVVFSQVHAPFPMWAPQDDELVARMQDIMKKSIAVTAYVGAPHCIIHPGVSPVNRERLNAQDEWTVNRDLYTALIPTLKQYNVMALLENLFSRDIDGVRFAAACSDFTEAASWVDKLNEIAGSEFFGFCLDTGHCNLARQNLYRAICLMGPRIKALHIQDNSGHLDDHRAPFTGSVDWEGFVRGLREIGYRGDLNFEAGNAVAHFPAEMTEACLHMLALTGEYFKKRICE